jgi:hypothetical protein
LYPDNYGFVVQQLETRMSTHLTNMATAGGSGVDASNNKRPFSDMTQPSLADGTFGQQPPKRVKEEPNNAVGYAPHSTDHPQPQPLPGQPFAAPSSAWGTFGTTPQEQVLSYSLYSGQQAPPAPTTPVGSMSFPLVGNSNNMVDLLLRSANFTCEMIADLIIENMASLPLQPPPPTPVDPSLAALDPFQVREI